MSFIEFYDCPQVAPPYLFPGMTLHMFGLTADIERLRDWCNYALSIAPEHVFEPLSPFVLLAISDYPRMILEGREDLGYSSQTEYSLMFPVVRFDDFAGFLVPVALTWATPFIGVDLPTSALAGQLVLGYPKLSGRFTVPPMTTGSFSAKVEMPGMPGTAAEPQDDKQELMTIIEVETGAPISATAAGIDFPTLALKGIDLPDFGIMELLQALDPNLFSLVNLKQIRDPADPPNPVYQALVGAAWQQSNIQDFQVYDGAKVTVTDNKTVRIAELMGLVGGTGPNGNEFAATFATSVRCDLRFGNATTIVQTA